MSAIPLRSPDDVMRFARLGSAHPTRLSFLRQLIRRAAREAWRVTKPVWRLDDEGFGRAVYRVATPSRVYSLVAFSTPLEESRRTDRVIAQAWDTSYVLFDGEPSEADLDRLEANAPRQEAGRFGPRDLVLARANKSVRLFESVVATLARGEQPDAEQLAGVGYLLRTTAVYGNGKFGIADRAGIADRPELAAPFQAEMLAVWLIRSFTLDLADHIARRRAPERAATLAPELRRRMGVGNATGLGMAPYLVRHPVLINNWFLARETALARVRNLPVADAAARAGFFAALAAMQRRVAVWTTLDERLSGAIAQLRLDLVRLAEAAPGLVAAGGLAWNALYLFAERELGFEAQEACVALLIEPHGALVDDLGEAMSADESEGLRIDGAASCAQTAQSLARDFPWAFATDFSARDAQARFWYVSAEKLEPRLGERYEEDGAERELPLAIARDMQAFAQALRAEPGDTPLADFLLRQPQWRHLARRARIAARCPYSEIRENLIDAAMRPIDILRAKLAFFGAHNFDPRSDRWLRIALFADEPMIEDMAAANSGEAAA